VVVLDRDIGTTDMVTELVLPGAWPGTTLCTKSTPRLDQ
jgi:hypothetical protein